MASDDRYCRTHGKFWDPYGSGCPGCREAEASMLEAIREASYRRANPGEYECPECKYISLQRDAPRCPLCRGTVANVYWERVHARERARIRRDAERREARIKSWHVFWVACYFPYLLPILSIVTTIALQTNVVHKITSQDLLFVIPGVNWLLCLVVILVGSSDSERRALVVTLAAYAALGGVGYVVNAVRRGS